MPSPNGGVPSRSHSSSRASCAACIVPRRFERTLGVVGGRRGRPEHGHHRVADVLHHRAAVADDRPVHLRPVAVELRGELRSGRPARRSTCTRGCRTSRSSRPSSRSARSPSPRCAACRRLRPAAAATPSRPSPRGSTIASCSSRRRRTAPATPADALVASSANRRSMSLFTAAGVECVTQGDRLHRAPAGEHRQQRLLLRGEVARARHRDASARRRSPDRAPNRRSRPT